MDQTSVDKKVDISSTFYYANIHFLKNVLRKLLFLDIVSVMKIKKNCLVYMYVYKVVLGTDLINELLRKSGGRLV